MSDEIVKRPPPGRKSRAGLLKEIERLKLDWMAESSQNRAKIERLNTLATDAITHLTDEVGAGDDPVAFVCAAYVASRQEIDRLKAVVDAVTGGIPSEITAALAKLEEST